MNYRYLCLAFIFSASVMEAALAQQQPSSRFCAFNRPRERMARLGGFTEVPDQGFTAAYDYGAGIEYRASRAYWGRCEQLTGQDAYDINCALSPNGGVHYVGVNADSAADFAAIDQWVREDMQEETVFQTAALNIHQFATCQKGLFDNYFGNPSTRMDLLNRGFQTFESVRGRINDSYRQLEPLRRANVLADSDRYCFNERCAGRVNEETVAAIADQGSNRQNATRLENEINLLLAGIPMANRPEMRTALSNLLRHNPNADRAAFERVFDEQMGELRGQVTQTLDTFNPLRHTLPDGSQARICVDGNMARQLYQSGQVMNVVRSRTNNETLATNIECQMGRRWGRAGRIATDAILLPTLFTGWGIARMAFAQGARLVHGASAAARVSSVMSSQAAVIGVHSADFAQFLHGAVSDCFRRSFLTANQGTSCNPENEVSVALEEASVAQCVSNFALYGITTVAVPAIKDNVVSIIRDRFFPTPNPAAAAPRVEVPAFNNLRADSVYNRVRPQREVPASVVGTRLGGGNYNNEIARITSEVHRMPTDFMSSTEQIYIAWRAANPGNAARMNPEFLLLPRAEQVRFVSHLEGAFRISNPGILNSTGYREFKRHFNGFRIPRYP